MNVAEQVYLPATQQSIWFRIISTPISMLYLFLVGVRNRLFDLGILRTKQLGQPVISVGNLVVGGTGKSPIVSYIAQTLLDRGERPAIVSRGYRSGLPGGEVAVLLDGDLLATGTTNCTIKPDEPMMLSAKLRGVPIVICADRYEGAKSLAKVLPDFNPTHWVLDDGFQHRFIHRDINIVLLDARDPFGNGFTLPRGSLREPISSLKRADAIIFTRATENFPLEDNVRKVHSFLKVKGQCLKASFKQEPPRLMHGSPKTFEQGVNFVCAIAHPQRISQNLKKEGYKIVKQVVKEDHATFTLEEIHSRCNPSLPIFTTEKDYWRDPEIFARSGFSTYILPMTVNFSLDNQLKLEKLLNL